MADKDYSQLTSATTATDTDLIAIYPTGGPLKKMTWAIFKQAVIDALGTFYLVRTNNLGDLSSASSGRANLGLGSVATLASSAVFQVPNNLNEVADAPTARTNIGAAASNAPTITGGMTFSGSSKQNPMAVASADFDLATAEFFIKAISGNTTFTFSNATASKAQAFLLELTISSSAVPTWPSSVQWDSGIEPTWPNGKNLIGFVTFDGGVNWTGLGAALAVS